jgi:two-component system LytT family response regulator
MIRCILVDDEPNNLEALAAKLDRHAPHVQVLACFTDAQAALRAIPALRPELIFLDIEMPVMNGFRLLEQLQDRNFEVIFVTAFDHYAIQAIRYSALDYLEGFRFIDIHDICCLHAEGNYTTICMETEKHLVSRPLKEFEDMLPGGTFLRIHHSHIINKDKVVRYIRGEGGQVVLSNGSTLDVSKRRKADFLREMANPPKST